MIDFPENEIQTYRFTVRGAHYMVEVDNGNHTVYVSLSILMPSMTSEWWTEVNDTDEDYWIGVVYAYKMTDDTTRNVYDSMDYRIMGYACHMLGQVPEFSDLERIVGYSRGVGCSDYDCWSVRAKEWLESERRLNISTFPNPLAEGAD